jgi:Xaa-Pro aminopeptidase
VCWITAHLVNRNECVRLLQREAESVYHGVLDYAFKEVYRKIRRYMTVPERRLYALLYFRQPLFNYHVAVTNPIITSFFTNMDAETQTLILLVLVFKMREWGGEKDLDKELERRWRAYLRFYPYWVEIIQDEEREAKRQQGAQRKTLSLHHPIFTDEDGNELRLEDTLAGPPSKPANLLQAVTLEDGAMLEHWAKTYCTAKQAIHVVRRFRDGKTETEIAKENGISQQAVSKSIRAACKRIGEGLIRDGVLEAG